MSVKCTVCRSRSEKYHECIHCGNRYDDVEKLAAHQLERGHPGGHAPARGPLARVERRSYLEMLNDKSDDAAADTETYELHDDDDVVNTNDSVEDAVPQGRSTSRGRRGGKRGVADAKSKRARSSTVAETPPPPPMLSPPSSTSTTPTVSTTAKLSTTPAKSPRELKIERFEQMLPDDIAVKYDDDGAPVTFQCTRRRCDSNGKVLQCKGKASNITAHVNLCKGRAVERNAASSLDAYLIGADTELVTQDNYEKRTLDIVIHCGVSFNMLEHDLFKKFAVALDCLAQTIVEFLPYLCRPLVETKN